MSTIYKYLSIILAILLVIVSISLFVQKKKNTALEEENKVSYLILNDTITHYKNKEKELHLMRESWILKMEQLEKVNKTLSEECKKLKDNPVVITKTVVEFKIDSLSVRDSIVRDTTRNGFFTDRWSYKDNWLSASGRYDFSIIEEKGSMHFDALHLKSDIYTSIIEKKKRLYVISRSTNPYLIVTNTEGGLIDKESSKVLDRYYNKKKKWNLSVTAGYYGIYSIQDNSLKSGPGIGISIGYSLLSW